MSIKVISRVLDEFHHRHGIDKFVLVVMAEYASDDGTNIFPALATLAKRIGRSASQVRRAIRRLETLGVVECTGNAFGGAPGQSRRYRIHLDNLATAGTDATPRADATPCTDAQQGLQPCERPLAPMRKTPCTGASQTVINRQGTVKEPSTTDSVSFKGIRCLNPEDQ